MNLKDLVAKVSSETGMPAGQARKVALSVLEQLSALVTRQEDFTSPVLVMKSFTTTGQQPSAENGWKDQPVRNGGRLFPRQPKACLSKRF